jgi:hypothetical protein
MLVSLKDEQMFNNLNFIKFRVHNWLTDHLDWSVCTFGQTFFTMDKFPYGKAMCIWKMKNINMFWMLEVATLAFEVLVGNYKLSSSKCW